MVKYKCEFCQEGQLIKDDWLCSECKKEACEACISSEFIMATGRYYCRDCWDDRKEQHRILRRSW